MEGPGLLLAARRLHRRGFDLVQRGPDAFQVPHPGRVSTSRCRTRSNSSTPSSDSRLRTCLLTAPCVTWRSRAAAVKLLCRAAASNACNSVIDGIIRRIHHLNFTTKWNDRAILIRLPAPCPRAQNREAAFLPFQTPSSQEPCNVDNSSASSPQPRPPLPPAPSCLPPPSPTTRPSRSRLWCPSRPAARPTSWRASSPTSLASSSARPWWWTTAARGRQHRYRLPGQGRTGRVHARHRHGLDARHQPGGVSAPVV